MLHLDRAALEHVAPDRVIPAQAGCGCPACDGRPLSGRPRGDVIRELVARARQARDHTEADEILRHAVHEGVKPVEMLAEVARLVQVDVAAGHRIDPRGRQVTPDA